MVSLIMYVARNLGINLIVKAEMDFISPIFCSGAVAKVSRFYLLRLAYTPQYLPENSQYWDQLNSFGFCLL